VEVDAEGRPKPVQVQGFFSFDFTLAEIKSLRAKQRLTQRSATYNGLFQVRACVRAMLGIGLDGMGMGLIESVTQHHHTKTTTRHQQSQSSQPHHQKQ
jgi:hypothetical protein